MEATRTWLGVSVPRGWTEVVASALITAVVGFVSLQFKEYLETREWDLLACAVDGACVGGGMFLLNLILKLAKS